MAMFRKLELDRKHSSPYPLRLNNNKKWSKRPRGEPGGAREELKEAKYNKTQSSTPSNLFTMEKHCFQ